MRTRIGALLAAAAFALCGCGGVRILGIVNAGGFGFPLWAARVAQPAETIIVIPSGTSIVIIIQLVEFDGGFVTAPVFLNGFDGLNPGFPSCNGIVNVNNNGLIAAPAGLPSVPTIGLTLNPVRAGTCTLPLNLGQSGVVPLSVTVR